MTPFDYKERYEKLQVTLAEGRTETVKVRKYRLASSPDHDFFDPAGMTAFGTAISNNKDEIELFVNTVAGQEKVTLYPPGSKNQPAGGFTQWRVLANYVFKGKGSPEANQIVLQLARHWNLSPTNLQEYADKYLGLDCNGFVGNFLWHTWVTDKSKDKPKLWTDLGVVEGQKGPDCGISGYLDPPRRYVTNWDDIDTTQSYILGRTHPTTKQIIDGGKDPFNIGHVVITEPGPRLERTVGGVASLGIRVIESTGGAVDPGLTDSWYYLQVPTKKKPANGIFDLERVSMKAGHTLYSFKIAPLDLPPKPAK